MSKIIGEIIVCTAVMIVLDALLGDYASHAWYVWLSVGIFSGSIGHIYGKSL